MGLANMPLFAAMTDKMRWHQARQSVLAENVANAETPGYKARDLKAYSFEEHLRDATSSDEVTTLATESGTLEFRWTGDNNFSATHSAAITVV